MTDKCAKLTPAEALRLLLDQVDYTEGACRVTEMVGAVLPKEVIERCHEALGSNPYGPGDPAEIDGT